MIIKKPNIGFTEESSYSPNVLVNGISLAYTLVNVHVDLVVYTRIAGTS